MVRHRRLGPNSRYDIDNELILITVSVPAFHAFAAFRVKFAGVRRGPPTCLPSMSINQARKPTFNLEQQKRVHYVLLALHLLHLASEQLLVPRFLDNIQMGDFGCNLGMFAPNSLRFEL
jgi:hypothetical protein